MATRTPRPGDLLAERYRVVDVLGRGGMGVVLAALDTHVAERPVAIKWMLPSATGARGEQRFLNEARAMARIEHPNVVEAFDVGFDEGPFLVMEHLRGESLEDRLERTTLPVEAVLAIMVPVCDAVHAAHAEGIVHRDLKPGNIFLCETRGGLPRPPKVLDFGVAKLFDEDDDRPRLSVTGVPIGTPMYMSPAQLDAAPPTPAFDVYALGVILYECLAHRPPFRSAGLISLINEIRVGEPEPLRRHHPLISEELEATVARAMHPDADRRSSLEELRHELLAAARHYKVGAVTTPGHEDPGFGATMGAPVQRVVDEDGPTATDVPVWSTATKPAVEPASAAPRPEAAREERAAEPSRPKDASGGSPQARAGRERRPRSDPERKPAARPRRARRRSRSRWPVALLGLAFVAAAGGVLYGSYHVGQRLDADDDRSGSNRPLSGGSGRGGGGGGGGGASAGEPAWLELQLRDDCGNVRFGAQHEVPRAIEPTFDRRRGAFQIAVTRGPNASGYLRFSPGDLEPSTGMMSLADPRRIAEGLELQIRAAAGVTFSNVLGGGPGEGAQGHVDVRRFNPRAGQMHIVIHDALLVTGRTGYICRVNGEVWVHRVLRTF